MLAHEQRHPNWKTGPDSARVSGQISRNGARSRTRTPSRLVKGSQPDATRSAMDKMFAGKELTMQPSYTRSMMVRQRTRQGIPFSTLSTQATARIQLRDLEFVTSCSTGSYITTGVETRTPVQCPPALLSMETGARVSRRTLVRHRSTASARYTDVSRLS